MLSAFHTLEVTVISAENLTTTNERPVKDKAFASLRTDDDRGPLCSDPKSYSTGVDEAGGQFPSWNEKLTVKLPASSRGVVVEVRRKGSSGDKIVGTARIPKSDFTGEYSVPVFNHLHFLSYRLRDSRGIKNGIINVSIRVTSSCSSQAGIGFRAGQCIGSSYRGAGGRTVIGCPAA